MVHRELLQADSLEELYTLRLDDPAGDTVAAFLRQPVPERRIGKKLPAIVLVAGRETGREAASVIPGPLDGVVLAVEYPAVIPATLGVGALLRRLPGIRRSAYRMPGILRGAGRFLAALPEVDSTRIALVGVSFGVPFATAAGTDPIFRGVALHHGGADLELLFRTTLPVENRFLRGVASRFAAWHFRELEPARHVGEISPTPLLLINGLFDVLVPRESALKLAEEARPPVRQIWLPYDHLMPGELAEMRELADSTLRHFPFLQHASPVRPQRNASGGAEDAFTAGQHGDREDCEKSSGPHQDDRCGERPSSVEVHVCAGASLTSDACAMKSMAVTPTCDVRRGCSGTGWGSACVIAPLRRIYSRRSLAPT